MEKQIRPLNFALIGVAGFIAERHLRAIKDTGNRLLAALDPFDSVGKIDHYFPEADFFVEFERFDRHIEKIRRQGIHMDYVSICSPNYLHDAHIRFALRHKADAICEKPVVLNPWNIDALVEIERETGKRVFNILQLRLHPSIVKLREKILNGPKDKIYDVDLIYITSRGHWYFISWKGDVQKSGGIATNIGIHFFDMLSWIFGKVNSQVVHVLSPSIASGFFQMEKARVRWFLSVDQHDLPPDIRQKDQRTYRSIRIDGEEIEFSDGFTDLHSQSYKEILAGKGFGLEETRNSIDTAYHIRNASPVGLVGDYHPFCRNQNDRSL